MFSSIICDITKYFLCFSGNYSNIPPVQSQICIFDQWPRNSVKCYSWFFLSQIFSFMHERVLHNASLYYILIDIEQNYMYLDSLETLLKTLVKDNVFLIHLSFDHLPFALSHSFSHKLSPLDLLRVGYYILQQWRAIAGWLSCSKQLSNDINWRHFPLSDAVNLTDWPIYSVVNAWHL